LFVPRVGTFEAASSIVVGVALTLFVQASTGGKGTASCRRP
jgi:hypothetical protein